MPLELDICAHLYAYTAQQSGKDTRELLDTVFSDLSTAGFDGVELMHTQIRSDDDARYVADLSERYGLPVIGCQVSRSCRGSGPRGIAAGRLYRR